MLPILYYDDINGPCRGILLIIKALNMEIDLKIINSTQKEQLDPEFIKVNPQLTVPTLVDGNLILSDSNAIAKYLVTKCAPPSELYHESTAIDEKLLFNSNELLPRLDNIIVPILNNAEKEVSKPKLDALKKCYEDINTFLTDAEFLAGKTLTIADLLCVASVSTASIILPVCCDIFPNLFKWYQRCKALPYYCDANNVGLKKIDVLIENKLRGRLS